MYNPDWRRPWLAIAIGCALPLGAAQACGPSFNLSLLDDRAQSLAELPDSNFAFEARRLGAAVPGLGETSERTLSTYWDEDNQRYVDERDLTEEAELKGSQLALVKHLRSLTDARQAEGEGASLAAELRYYLAGAVAFANHDNPLASAYFQRVLDLPADQRRTRSTWAAYSLGRAQARMSSRDGLPAVAGGRSEAAAEQFMAEAAAAARQAFQLTRQLVAAGMSDPMELAIASLGEEARVLKTQGDWGSAIGLYASQYRHGSINGYSSLRQLSAELANLPDEQLLPLLGQVQVQQLLTARLLSRIGWLYGEQPSREGHLVELLQRSEIATPANAERLAALSYQYGHYEHAARFLEQAGDGGLAWWLRAKLALRAGDTQRASVAYARAAKAFPQEENWGARRTEDYAYEEVKPRCRVEGESAILALQRGDYLEAFDQLYRSGDIYWADTAQIAERVLSVDELKGYVDAQVPANPPSSEHTDVQEDHLWPGPPAVLLRELLGRRLLREGRYAEAPAYFTQEQLRTSAQHYAEARQATQSRWTAVGRADAYYQAAKLVREQGMELLGYEMSPDFRIYDGAFAPRQVETTLPDALLGADEARRQNANLAQPNRRYHYRWVAADLANQAADLLPARSQAFAAVLCQASGWLHYRDLAGAQGYYRRYVKEGPYVAWAANFGFDCQEPDFERASQRLWSERGQALRQALRPYKYWLPLGLLAVLASGIYWRQRRRALAIVDKTAEESRNE